MSLLFKYPVSAKDFTTKTRGGRTATVAGTVYTFQGDTQPMNSRDILALTEGRISTGMIRVFSETALTVSTEGAGATAKGTYVLFEGKWYEITQETSWNSQSAELTSINHYEYVAEYRELSA